MFLRVCLFGGEKRKAVQAMVMIRRETRGWALCAPLGPPRMADPAETIHSAIRHKKTRRLLVLRRKPWILDSLDKKSGPRGMAVRPKTKAAWARACSHPSVQKARLARNARPPTIEVARRVPETRAEEEGVWVCCMG
jgi:hypothetical protein